MYNCFISAVFIAFFILINSLTIVKGQLTDSLLYTLNHYTVKDDDKKFKLLCDIASNSVNADSILKYSELAIKLAEKLNRNPAKPLVF